MPKLLEQMGRLGDPLEQRIIAFVAEMPTLQKMGQIIARNRNLDPAFRRELIRLENSIRDVDPESIFKTIREQLATRIEEFDVRLEKMLHSEASVSAVVRFSYWDGALNRRREGVFKVLKPKVAGYFWEEISVLDGLVGYLKFQCRDHILEAVDLHEIIDEIREHLMPELDCRNEQAHLLEAGDLFASVRGVRVPSLIPQLSTDVVTAMSYERGCKVTQAFAGQLAKRKALANRLIDVLIARPMVDSREVALLHADPHAGNVFADEASGELVLFDWALVERLSLAERRNILRFVAGFSLRDEALTTTALVALSRKKSNGDSDGYHTIEDETRLSIGRLPVLGLPALRDLTDLVDRIAMRGVSFDRAMLVFRKTLLTLEGVIGDLSAEIDVGERLYRYAAEESVARLLGFSAIGLAPLRLEDLWDLLRAAQWFWPRTQVSFLKSTWGAVEERPPIPT